MDCKEHAKKFLEKFDKLLSNYEPRVFKVFCLNLKFMRDCLLLLNSCIGLVPSPVLLDCRRRLRSMYRAEIRRSKIAANEELIADADNPSRILWRLVGSKRPLIVQRPISLDVDVLNDFFVGTAAEILAGLPKSSRDPRDFVSAYGGEEFAFVTITEHDVIDIFSGLKKSHSRDIYGLSGFLMSECRTPFIGQLTSLINSSINSSCFPACLKEAVVTPIFKKGDSLKPCNYRPISILPFFSKVLESVLRDQMIKFLEQNELLTPRQFGFRRGMGTQTALISYIQSVLDGFEDLEYTNSIFFDLSKAFDCISHSLLVDKMVKYGFGTSACSMIASYLSDRRQCVRIAEMVSGMRDITSGVPQGSMLGPILFLIYVNDLPSITDKAIFHMYVDDTTISLQSADFNGLCESSERIREDVIQWFTSNHMAVNLEKTGDLILSLRDYPGTDNPSSVKFLGLMVDPVLGFGPHIDSLSFRLNRCLFLLRRLSRMITPRSLRQIYYGLFYSHMTYGVLIWGHVPRAQRVIFGLQRKAIRIMCRLGFREDCRDGFVNIGILTFPAAYILICVLYAHGTLCERTVGSDVHDYHTRGCGLLRLKQLRLDRSRNGVNYWSTIFYNCLPVIIRGWSLSRLKRSLGSYLSGKCFYSIDDYLCNDFGDFISCGS